MLAKHKAGAFEILERSGSFCLRQQCNPDTGGTPGSGELGVRWHCTPRHRGSSVA